MNTSPVPLSEADMAQLREALKRCSEATMAAAVRFRQSSDVTAISTIVYGLIERYQPAAAKVRLSAANDASKLGEDLGLDSLSLLEIVLTLEEVLKIRIQNEELRSIRTLGDINKFLSDKIHEATSANAARQYNRDDIIRILPQQPPFLFLDEAEVDGDMVKGSYTVRGDETFLKGHFKDEPVFPASIVLEAAGQACCLWVLERAKVVLGRPINSGGLLFAAMEGAHFYRKVLPGDRIEFEIKQTKLRVPLVIFEGTGKTKDGIVARLEGLTLILGDEAKQLAPSGPGESSAVASPDAGVAAATGTSDPDPRAERV